MNDMNQIILEGKVCEKGIRKTLGGDVVTLIVKNYRTVGTENETFKITVVSFGTLAEFVNSSKINAGLFIRLVGRLKYMDFLDENNNKQSVTTIVAEHIEIRPS